MKAGAILAVVSAGLSTPAYAHSAIPGMRGFLGGIVHPLSDPMTAFPLVAAALALGQQGERNAPRLLGVVLAAFVVGGLVPDAAGVTQNAATLGSLLAFGLVLLVSRVLPFAAAALLFASYATLAAMGQAREFRVDEMGTRAFVGAAVAHLVVVAYGFLAVRAAKKPWMKIGLRVAGSWAIAAGLLLLALTFRPN